MKRNQYSLLSVDKQEEHLSNYAVQSFSYSSLTKYMANPLAYLMHYVYGERDEKKSDNMIIGIAVHSALEAYFNNREYDWEEIELGKICDEYIDVLNENVFKMTKKWEEKGLDELREYLKKQAKICIQYFWEQKKWFDENVQLVISTEMKIYDFIMFETLNYNVPIPCICYIDLVFVDKNGELAVMDYKTGSITSYEDAELGNMVQMTLNNACINASMINPRDEDMWQIVVSKFPKVKEGLKTFYICQIKGTKNRDNSPQVVMHKIDIKKKLPFFEAFVLSQIQSLMEAVSNPEHNYSVNLYDNLTDKEKILAFWISQYKGSEAYKAAEGEKIQKNVVMIASSIIKKFKENSQFTNSIDMSKATPEEKINYKLSVLGAPATVCHTIDSHSCTTYLLEPKATTTISKIKQKSDDLAHALGVDAVRISNSLIVKDDNSYIAIEVRKKFGDRTFPENPGPTNGISLGESTMGEIISWDYSSPSTPHLLIAGATGSGKSWLIKSILSQWKGSYEIFDPKFEFNGYGEQYCDIEEIILRLNQLVWQMDEHYKNGTKANFLIIFDEASDVLTRTKMNKSDETLKTAKDCLLILAQKGRACGIHIVLASQRVTAKLFDGDVKANFIARVCLKTAAAIDSRVMLDQDGAEDLGGFGDALYYNPLYKEPIRIQCYAEK